MRLMGVTFRAPKRKDYRAWDALLRSYLFC
jgi:hypothetical protein